MPFHLKMTGASYADDARVKVPSFQKVTFFYNVKFLQRRYPFVCCLFDDVSDCRDLRRTSLK